MNKKYTKSLFLFHRDLRVHDNTGLTLALEMSDEVMPLFIFDQAQISDENKYKSMNAIQFMINSLHDLDDELQKHCAGLHVYRGDTHELMQAIIKKHKIDALFFNADYTPFAQKRDASLHTLAKKMKIAVHESEDILLHNPQTSLNKQGNCYRIFTPFYKHLLSKPIAQVCAKRLTNYVTKKPEHNLKAIAKEVLDGYENEKCFVQGGLKEGKEILDSIADFKKYNAIKDIPSCDTTYLAAHYKFGTVSIRVAFEAIKTTLGLHHPLIRQLLWREFFVHTLYHYPIMLGTSLQEKFRKITWKQDKKGFERWCQGLTGFPLVDAGMRQLNETGFMHNRVRMVTASFLVKDLHIDWRWGERYFAQKLVDYDPAVNNGNWQWVASTGFDSQPYFRIFNPWLQQKKFDPEAIYIKQWVPELKKAAVAEIHKAKRTESIGKYPAPMVDHAVQSAIAKALYRSAGTER